MQQPAALECDGVGWRWLQIASITLAAAPLPIPLAPASRAPRCERRPTIVYEMIMVARYEVAGSRKAVRHLDWPVGSYKRREARADAARLCATARRDAAAAAARANPRRCRKLRLFRGDDASCPRETVWIYGPHSRFRVILAEGELDRSVSTRQQWKCRTTISNPSSEVKRVLRPVIYFTQ